MTPVPAEIVDAARRVGEWMEKHGYDRWQLGPCADRGTVERLHREIEGVKLRVDSDREFMRQLEERLALMLGDVSARR